jgi:RNA polymerase sigma factor (sigma-70 family)
MTSNKPGNGKELTTLLVRAQRQPALFDEVARAVRPGLLGWLRKAARARGLRLSAEDREDLVQVCLLKAWRKRASFNANLGSAFTWFCAIAGNALKDHLRARRPRTYSLTTPEGGTRDVPGREPEPAEALIAEETERRLRAAVARADPLVRAVWALRLTTDLTYEQIAAQLGERPGALACALHRFKVALRRALDV